MTKKKNGNKTKNYYLNIFSIKGLFLFLFFPVCLPFKNLENCVWRAKSHLKMRFALFLFFALFFFQKSSSKKLLSDEALTKIHLQLKSSFFSFHPPLFLFLLLSNKPFLFLFLFHQKIKILQKKQKSQTKTTTSSSPNQTTASTT